MKDNHCWRVLCNRVPERRTFGGDEILSGRAPCLLTLQLYACRKLLPDFIYFVFLFFITQNALRIRVLHSNCGLCVCRAAASGILCLHRSEIMNADPGFDRRTECLRLV
jgi:hypothetical protein